MELLLLLRLGRLLAEELVVSLVPAGAAEGRNVNLGLRARQDKSFVAWVLRKITTNVLTIWRILSNVCKFLKI